MTFPTDENTEWSDSLNNNTGVGRALRHYLLLDEIKQKLNQQHECCFSIGPLQFAAYCPLGTTHEHHQETERSSNILRSAHSLRLGSLQFKHTPNGLLCSKHLPMQPTSRALFACGRRCQHLGLRLSLRPVSDFSVDHQRRFCRRCRNRKKFNWYSAQFDRYEIVNIQQRKLKKKKKKNWRAKHPQVLKKRTK